MVEKRQETPYKSISVSQVVEEKDGMRVRTITSRGERWPEHVPNWHREQYGDAPYYYDQVQVQAVLPDDSDETKERFGFNFGSEIWKLDEEELASLLAGKVLAREINGGEYSLFLTREER